MFDFFYNHWATVITTVSIPLAYVFGGKQKQNIEIKKSNTDAVKAMSDLYGDFLEDYKERTKDLMLEIQQLKDSNRLLQESFNAMSLAYAKEKEISENWEKLHRELTIAHNALQKDHEKLKKDHELLRKEFLLYKKTAPN
jgi:vacuolar-type H+-ATPase subunit I/STV1